jgi:hypothetical protein
MPGVTAAVAVAGLLAAQAAALSVPDVPLEDRLAACDVVAVGEVTKVDPGSGTPGGPDFVRPTMTVMLTQVLKGPADLKEVRMPYIVMRPPPPGGQRVYEVGDTEVWQLKKSESTEGYYVNAFRHFFEPRDRAPVIAAVLSGLKDPKAAVDAPEKADATAEEAALAARSRLSGAYCLVRGGKPETRFPHVESKSDEKPLRDTRGYLPLAPELVNRAMTLAIASFASTEESEAELAQRIMEQLGCPLGSLRPTTQVRSDDENRQYPTPEHRQAMREDWSKAITAWWAREKDNLRFYVPDPAVTKASTPTRRDHDQEKATSDEGPGEPLRLKLGRP